MKAPCRNLILAGLAAFAASAAPARPDWTRAVAEDLSHPVRPGGVEGRPFWNGNAKFFMYPPAFDFSDYGAPGKTRYSYEICDAHGAYHYFEARSPRCALTNVWAKLPTGHVSVTCRAIDGNCLVIVGTRAFWKSAPFTGDYPPAKWSHAESAKKALAYILAAPSNRYLLEKGELDPTFTFNTYPTKMLAATVRAVCALVATDPSRRGEAVKLARLSADWLIAHAEKADAPLAHFPPTYRGDGNAAGLYAGQIMTIYPAEAALAYLDLFALTGDGKYRDAAVAVGETYLRLQGGDGTWALRVKIADGKDVAPENRLIPIATVIPLMDRLAEITGRETFRTASARAFENLERTRIATWNWEGQFEDVNPTRPYVNLTKHDACATAIYLVDRFPKDKAKLALARELLRFAEDQFVCWERPFDEQTYLRRSCMQDLRNWKLPAVLEQYCWYNPIDASAAKLIRTYLALWRAERKPLDLAKARALGDSVTRVQWNDGGIPTHWSLLELQNGIWINCHMDTALAMKELSDIRE